MVGIELTNTNKQINKRRNIRGSEGNLEDDEENKTRKNVLHRTSQKTIQDLKSQYCKVSYISYHTMSSSQYFL
jgi:hypothetical protein